MKSEAPSATRAAVLRELLGKIDELMVFAFKSPMSTELYGKIERAVKRMDDAIYTELKPLEQQLAKDLLTAPIKEPAP